MPTPRDIDARIDIQFHPQGADYTYDPTDAAEEAAKLKRVLSICDRINQAFLLLLPPKTRRKWWDSGLKLKANGNIVKSSEYASKVNARLETCKITHGELEKLRGKLPKDLVWADGSPFPPPKDPTAGAGETAMNFEVETGAGRVYYSPGSGLPSCCGPKSLLVNQKELELRDPDLMHGRIRVMLYTHFDPAQGL